MSLWDDIKHSLKVLARCVLALGLIGYGCYGLYREKDPKAVDPHAILVGVGLLITPDIPELVASGIRSVGAAIAEAWKRDTKAGSNAP